MSMTLLGWRRTVANLYANVRATSEADPTGALERFRAGRDALFRDHPDSPLTADARSEFAGLRYWPYDPDLRFEVDVEPLPPTRLAATSITGESFSLSRIGRVTLPVGTLAVYWIDSYGGGALLPFRDATSGTETYAGGRYVLDTVKGADLGGSGDRLVVDFNYAYHPSCAYDPRWSCPLAPQASELSVPIRAGERLQNGWEDR